MAEYPSHHDLLPQGSLQQIVEGYLREAETEEGRQRIVDDESLEPKIKLELLSADARQEILELLRPGPQRNRMADQYPEVRRFLVHKARERLRPDPERLRSWVLGLLRDPAQREQRVRSYLLDVAALGPDAFCYAVRGLSQLDVPALALQEQEHKGPAPVPADPADTLRASLEVEDLLVQEVRSVFSDRREWGADWVKTYVRGQGPRVPMVDMSVASVPKVAPRVRRLEDAVERWAEHDGRCFAALKCTCKEIGERVFGADKQVFFSKGAKDAFQTALLALLLRRPQLRIVAATPGEYQPMLSLFDERVSTVPLEDPAFTEDDVIRGVERRLRDNAGVSDVVVLLSSVLRMGGKTLDAERIFREVRRIADGLGAEGPQQVHLFADIAQGQDPVPSADVMLFSKRTGGPVVAVDTKRYPDTGKGSLRYALEMRNGFELRQIARTVSVLHSMDTGIRYGLPELMRTPELWPYAHGPHYGGPVELSQSLRDIRQSIPVMYPTVSRLLRLVVPAEPADSSATPPVDALLRLEPAVSGAVDIPSLQRALEERGVRVGAFTLEALTTEPGEGIADLRKRLASPDVDAAEAVRLIGHFQDANQAMILWSLAPEDPTADKEKVLERFEHAVRLHDVLRLYVTEENALIQLQSLLTRTEAALRAMEDRKTEDRSPPSPRQAS